MVAKVGARSVLGLLLALASPIGCGGSAAGPGKAAVASAPEQAGRKYQILLKRQDEPGKQYPTQATDSTISKMVATRQGKLLKEEQERNVLSFSGTRKALAAGVNQPMEYVVQLLSFESDGQKKSLLPAGTKVLRTPVAQQWGYESDGQPVSEEVGVAFSSLFGSVIKATTDDDVFGTKEPRAVGESWSIDLSKLADEELAFEPDGASGTTRLVAVRNVGGIECLEIEAELSIPKARLKDAPEGAKMLATKLEGRFYGSFPTDTKLPVLQSGMVMDIDFKMEVPSEQGPIQMDATTRSEQSFKSQ